MNSLGLALVNDDDTNLPNHIYVVSLAMQGAVLNLHLMKAPRLPMTLPMFEELSRTDAARVSFGDPTFAYTFDFIKASQLDWDDLQIVVYANLIFGDSSICAPLVHVPLEEFVMHFPPSKASGGAPRKLSAVVKNQLHDMLQDEFPWLESRRTTTDRVRREFGNNNITRNILV